MKYAIVTIGSQGDIAPFIALGKRLQSHGHTVRIAAFRNFEEYIRSAGFEYAPLAGDATEVIRLLIGESVSVLQYFRNLAVLLHSVKEQFLSDVAAACEGMDAILYSLLGAVAWHVAEKLNIPCFRVFFYPADPTGEFPAMTAPELPLGPVYNRFTYLCGDLLWTRATRKLLGAWREEMGLASIRPFSFPYRSMQGKPIPTLYAYSPVVAPKPLSWDGNQYLTGYWVHHPETDWGPDQSLIDFLNAGRKPLYIGFGSVTGGDFADILEIVLESLRITRQRAVLSAGWGRLQGQNLPEFIYPSGYVPHEWLFQHVSVAVHHGGAGTTAAGLRAGLPSIIVPFGGDQPYWGSRIYQLGAGPKPIPRTKLSVGRLAAAISQAVGNQEMLVNAGRIGEQLRNEDGVGNAVGVIEQWIKK